MRPVLIVLCLAGLVGCAATEEEVVMVEPEPIAAEDAAAILKCASGEGGIGGTGCAEQ